MKNNGICPDCDPAPVSHAVEYWSEVIIWLMQPYFKPLELLRRTLAPLYYRHVERREHKIIRFFSVLGLLKIKDKLDESDNSRIRCFWEEGVKRGYKMYKVYLWRFPINVFLAELSDRTIVFEGLPRPSGVPAESLDWMDNKGIMQRNLNPGICPSPEVGYVLLIKRHLSYLRKLTGR